MLSAKLKSAIPHFKKLPNGLKITDWRIILATWFGSGLMRPAPGTMGTLAAVPFGMYIQHVGGMMALCIAIAVVFAIGLYVSDYYEKKSGEHDASSIVIDEVVGIWIAAIPAATEPFLWVMAFILFRIFDILKPWPVSMYDKRKTGAYNVMMDDVVAGILALLGVATFAIIYLKVGAI